MTTEHKSTVVITGGGGALCAEIATALACHGFRLILVDINGERLNVVVEQIREKGGEACRLADPEREMHLQIYLPEFGATLEELADNVNDELRRSGRVIVVVSEGFDVGNLGESKDLFGHTQFSANKTTVVQVVVNYLNEHGLAARGQVPGTDQRDSIIYASTIDLEEAYRVSQHAVSIAIKKGTGYMATICRSPRSTRYTAYYGMAPLGLMANSERVFPKEWIAPSGIDVTDEFLRYARPLIGTDWPTVPLVGGLQRFTQLEPVFAERKCEDYVPETYQERSLR